VSCYDKLYSPQMVVTMYTTENDLTKKKKKEKNENTKTHKQMACTYLN